MPDNVHMVGWEGYIEVAPPIRGPLPHRRQGGGWLALGERSTGEGGCFRFNKATDTKIKGFYRGKTPD
jgi:hypothetical protein